MIVHRMLQTSSEWWQIRRAKPTASSFDKIITAVQGKPSASQKPYIYQLLEEAAMPDAAYFSRLGVWRGNDAMAHGQDTEAEARRWYEMETNNAVQQVGFCEADCGLYGCSPDGVIGLEETERLTGYEWPAARATVKGLLELKCPQLSTHFSYLDDGGLPTEYKVQVHGQLFCTGAEFIHFVSYHPDCKDGLVVRVEPDDFTKKVATELAKFIELYLSIAERRGVAIVKRPELVAADGEIIGADGAEF